MTHRANRAGMGLNSLIAALAVIASAWSSSCTAQPLPLRIVADVPLGQATRRFDYVSLDPTTGRLFIADLSGGRVLVADVRANRLLDAIPEVAGAHGVIAVPELGRAFASATGSQQVVAIDTQTLKVVGRGPGGRYPDGIAWAPTSGKLYVSDETGRSVGVFDPKTNTLVKQIPLGGEVGNTQFDATDGLIYSNNQTTGDLVAIDPKTDTVSARWRLKDCGENHGLLIDAARQLAYVACQGNAKLVVFSLKTHEQVAEISIGRSPDVLAADLSQGRLYVAGESGIVTVLDISATSPRKMGEALLADNAHVVGVDPAAHRVYFPLRNVDGKAVLRVMEPAN
jgi:DNA-binding beta-propeller fold protein YncE